MREEIIEIIKNICIQNGRVFFINNSSILTFTSLKNIIIRNLVPEDTLLPNEKKREIELNIYLAFEELANDNYMFTLLFFDGSQRRHLGREIVYTIKYDGSQIWYKLIVTEESLMNHQYYKELKHRDNGLPALIHINGDLEYWVNGQRQNKTL